MQLLKMMEDRVGIVAQEGFLFISRSIDSINLVHDVTEGEHPQTHGKRVIPITAWYVDMSAAGFEFAHEVVCFCFDLQFTE